MNKEHFEIKNTDYFGHDKWHFAGRFMLRRVSSYLRGYAKPAIRNVARAYQILQQDGAGVLASRLRARLHKSLQSHAQTLEILPIPDEYEMLIFQQHDQPFVSIVVPVHNKFDYTYRCLLALQAQTSEHSFEVIVVNDASTDNTREYLEKFHGLRLLNNETNLGFVLSCNRGAGLSHANYIVFLNNDTQVLSGWLDALMETFLTRPDAGLVGSRLLYPDGRLQEAGGIVWADGSAWNYGHRGDPQEPRYSYLRAVDYCSAASIALPRVLFRKLGGFDEFYAPGYYEDTDLAFRVRKAGCEVYYQPTSAVIHFEGISAGKNPADQNSVKRFQEINREKFVSRWASILQHHRNNGIEPELEKERSVTKRILVCDTYMPMPDRESGSLRMFNLLTILTQFGYKVTFAPVNLQTRQPYLKNLQKRGIECLHAPYIRSVVSHIRKSGKLYDTIILSRADVADDLIDVARFSCPDAQIVFDTVDLHYLRETREAQIKRDEKLIRMARRRKKQEIASMRAADLTLVVSPFEKETITQEHSGLDIQLLSNIHEIHGSQRPFEERRDILFIGGFNHPPNTDAVLYFVHEIFPMILAEIPAVKFHVLGDKPPKSILDLENDSIKVSGYLEDISGYFNRCRISVAPLRYGAGVKGKINTSLSYGMPVVGTKIATEGMYLVDNESVLIADKPQDFADAVVRLYSDQALWNRISAGGLSVMRTHFSFDAASNVLRDILGRNSARNVGSWTHNS